MPRCCIRKSKDSLTRITRYNTTFWILTETLANPITYFTTKSAIRMHPAVRGVVEMVADNHPTIYDELLIPVENDVHQVVGTGGKKTKFSVCPTWVFITDKPQENLETPPIDAAFWETLRAATEEIR